MRTQLPSIAPVSSVSLALVTMVAACNGAEDTAPARAQVEAEAQPAPGELPPKPAPTAKVDEIEDEPQRFYGRTVTLSGEIENVRSNTAFELEGDDWLFPEELLVLTKSPVRLGTSEELDDMDVIVTGKIVPMVVVDLERELGWDLEPELEAEFERKPVLIAESIRAVDEVARWSETDAREGEIANTAAEVADTKKGEPTTLAAFSKAPADNLGKTVQGEATVGKVISDRAFWVNTAAPSGPVLMVVREDVPQHNTIEIEAGQRIRFTAQSHGPQDAQALGGTLEDDAKEAIAATQGFLAAHHRDVQILDKATDPPKG